MPSLVILSILVQPFADFTKFHFSIAICFYPPLLRQSQTHIRDYYQLLSSNVLYNSIHAETYWVYS